MTAKTMKSKEISNYLKELDIQRPDGTLRKHSLYDFNKIWEAEEEIVILLSPRGAYGKSVGAKKLARDIKIDEDLNSVLVMNLQDQIKREKNKFLTKPKELFSDIFDNVGIDNTGLYTFKREYIVNKKTGEEKETITDKEYYQWFHSLSGAEKAKGSRANIGLMIYDELNVGTKDIRGDQTELILNLIATYSDAVNFEANPFRKLICMANFKTLNSKFLMDLGITKIDRELTRIKYGTKSILILCPQMTKDQAKQLDEDHKDDWGYQLAKQTGKAGHIFLNENLYDDLNSVKEYKQRELDNLFSLRYVFAIKSGYIYLYWSDSLKWHSAYRLTNETMLPTYTLSKKHLKENTTLVNTAFKNSMLNYIEKGQMSFQNIYTREQLIDTLIKL